MFERLRIVWNVTNRCIYNCWFCAASANQNCQQENARDKMAILQSILSASRPTEIDFSGGSPWHGEDSVEVMLAARQALGREAITVSGLGISTFRFSDGFLSGLAREYDFTYDQPFWYRDVRPGYNIANRLAIMRLQKLGIPCGVTLALRESNDTWRSDMVEELLKMNPTRVHLLQLMPLGNNRRAFTSSELLADSFGQQLYDKGYAGTIRKSCAMTGHCNGFCDHKLGLDQYGNLYCCIWAADLGVPNSENPFYLGNLLKQPLGEILDAQSNHAKKWPRNFCHVLEFEKSRSQ